jgi:hypothetical protein
MSYKILKAINNIHAAWQEVISTCMNVYPEWVHDFSGFKEVPKIVIKIAAIDYKLRFDSVDPDGVTKLLHSQSQPPTNEKLEYVTPQLRNSSSKKKSLFYRL